MNNVITNEEFELALKNMDNRLIMEKACSSFKKSIEREELYRCKLIALWEAMIHWNPEGRKFTSFLYQKVNWECLKVLQKQKKHRSLPLTMDTACRPYQYSIDELVEVLPPELQDILVKRFVHRMTLREISQIYGSCHETVRRKIHRAIKILKNSR